MASGCSEDPNKCRSQVELNRLFKDPILGPFLNSRSITDEDKSGVKKIGGYGWISLPTTSSSGLTASKSRLNAKDDNINFFAIKRYNPEESKIIYEALYQSMRSGKGTGESIIFDEYGHFAYWNGGEGDEANTILPNPIIPRGKAGSAEKRSSVLLASDASNCLAETQKDFLSSTNIYYYNEKMIANPQMTYFILTRDTVPSMNSVYYLVYNPIHRKKFQEYYTHLLGFEGVWNGSKLTKPGSSGGFQKKGVVMVPSGKKAPSFGQTIARYCNAIKIGSDSLQNGKAAEHYADPTCNFTLGSTDADFSLLTGKNFTQSNLVYSRYAPINGTDDDAKARFISNKSILMGAPGNNQLHWPCEAEWDKVLRTPFEFAKNSGLYGNNSNSFVNVLGNAYLNNINRGTNALNVRGEDFNKAPSCPTRNLTITTCVNHVDIAGNAKGNNIAMQSACGAPAPKSKPDVVADDEDSVMGNGDADDEDSVMGNGDADDEDAPLGNNTMLYIVIALIVILILILIGALFLIL